MLFIYCLHTLHARAQDKDDANKLTVGDCRKDDTAQQIFDECKPEDTDCKEQEIVEALFRLPHNKMFYKYNRFGKRANLKKYGLKNYIGGHPGWDVQTKDKLTTRCFYSLTAGTVLLDGKNTRGKPIRNNTIAVYDPDKGMTTFYAHASKLHPSIKKGFKVKVGDPLGTQGDSGNTTGVHVHLEVHVGKTTITSYGTEDKKTKIVDPVQYLYDSVRRVRRQ